MITRTGFSDLGGLTGSAGPITASYTNAGNIMFIFAGASEPPTSVTFNGAPLTLLMSIVTGGTEAVNVYYLKSPDITTANVVLSFAGSAIFVEASAVSYAGVDLSAFDQTSQGIDSVNELSYTTIESTTSDNCWGVGFAHSVTDSIASFGGSFTTVVIPTTFLDDAIGDTNGPIHPAGPLTFTSVGNNPNISLHFFVSLRPAPIPPFYRSLQWTAARPQ